MGERTQEQVHEVCEQACSILQATHDGDNLDPFHLWIIQEAVNGSLNEDGIGIFKIIHDRVKGGIYQRSWLHGIEHLTRDHEGYVYWKGSHVEHYSFGSKYEEEKKAAKELARRCRILESRGIKPTCNTAVWLWKDELMCI